MTIDPSDLAPNTGYYVESGSDRYPRHFKQLFSLGSPAVQHGVSLPCLLPILQHPPHAFVTRRQCNQRSPSLRSSNYVQRKLCQRKWQCVDQDEPATMQRFSRSMWLEQPLPSSGLLATSIHQRIWQTELFITFRFCVRVLRIFPTTFLPVSRIRRIGTLPRYRTPHHQRSLTSMMATRTTSC